jgi:hypothetical protein
MLYIYMLVSVGWAAEIIITPGWLGAVGFRRRTPKFWTTRVDTLGEGGGWSNPSRYSRRIYDSTKNHRRRLAVAVDDVVLDQVTYPRRPGTET